ncbi:hypothetical protein BDY17DRAFT_324253 [Neohortaea acidophila]|uniref:Uncharacterized protein n=1 Tax=Neohortaea acidophila TaxID=245834 RepID=A0A6A6PTU9_9PEZI|nr:uncharacterized protein BDY17DRAFT_324253 [Neohortaea acidophila]KAF2483528.1 hypothetical protein BDY17DRAFT_324253 [Neohortaea acidophila]
MSSAQAQAVYNRTSFQEPDEAQETFARQYDLSRPDRAMSSYQRIMHQHTKQQFEMAHASSRRRSPKPNPGMAKLTPESSHSSIDSTSS